MGRERSAAWLLKEALRIGPHCGRWADAVLLNRGVEGIRSLYGLRSLTRQHASTVLEKACEQALSHGAYRLRDLRRLLEQPAGEATPSFLEAHPLIREMGEYGALLRAMYPPEEAFNKQEVRQHE
jgi:hypothetical protein